MAEWSRLSLRERWRWVRGLLNKSRSHDRKQRYSTKASALRAVEAMERKAAPKKFDAYRCLWCRGFHIGRSVREGT